MDLDAETPNLFYESESVVENGWFREVNKNWDGYSLSLKADEVLFQQKSKYQDVLVFRSKSFGNVLVLNGIIQCSERDEFTYQELISHLPMNMHPNPEKVLIIGGGDGGVIREVLKYDSVKEVVLCEIDQMVIDVAKKHLPHMSCCMDDPRVKLQVGDGIEYVRQHPKEYDVIITDSSDPEGPAVGLFQKEYYSQLWDCLKDDGIACCQGESFFLDIGLMRSMVAECKEVFPSVGWAIGNTPTYPTGLMGYMLASKQPNVDFSKPVRTLSDEDVGRMKLKYYNSDMHRACFALPQYAKDVLKGLVDNSS